MSQSESAENALRARLAGESAIPRRDLHGEFLHIEKTAYETWVPLLGHQKGSHNGPKHLRGVEEQICSLMRRVPEIDLTPIESYILLCGVLFHDVGKCVQNGHRNRYLTSVRRYFQAFQRQGLAENADRKDGRGEIHHAVVSAGFVNNERDTIGLSDEGIADLVALVCAAHHGPTARHLLKIKRLDDSYLDQFGRVRIGWLCALLALGDDLDNSYHRVTPDWAEGGQAVGRFRAGLAGCEVDLQGRLLTIHVRENIASIFEESKDAKSTDLYWIARDVAQKRALVQTWHRQLRQMHVELLDVAVGVRGRLWTLKPEPLKTMIKSLDRYPPVPVSEYDRANFRRTVEPFIRQMKIDRVMDATIHLRFNSFGKSTFPWETLATEAGIESIEEVRRIFHRLATLALVFYEWRPLKRKLAARPHLSFTALDGEWTIRFDAPTQPRAQGETDVASDDRKLRENSIWILRAFYRYVETIVAGGEPTPESIGLDEKVSVPLPERKLTILNDDLSYLFDEDYPDRGILLPRSQSRLHPLNRRPNVGVNLVIAGPSGVGKSTLAMELVAQGRIIDDGRRPLCTYYSLEQPIESIRHLAERMGIPEKATIAYHPNPAAAGDDNPSRPGYVRIYEQIMNGCETVDSDPILLLPKLAPRTYGDVIDEERLFWFRYKQIARLLEAQREIERPALNAPAQAVTKSSHFILTSIVLDNLNAFSRHPLARQRVHQLFNLIAWGGVLGIHIIEDAPGEEANVFSSEVTYLADIVIRLDWRDDGYRYKVMEVTKSRCQRHVLGAHPFKIRSVRPALSSSHGARAESSAPAELKLGQSKPMGFEVFPSIHTTISRSEKHVASPPASSDNEMVRFAVDRQLQWLVERDRTSRNNKDTGVRRNHFVILQGQSGGHKLAVAMNYLHAKGSKNSALILNMGQPIEYMKVAGFPTWWSAFHKVKPTNPVHKCTRLAWNDQKLTVDLFCPRFLGDSRNLVGPKVRPPKRGCIFVMNFHTGFLLPEEFIKIVTTFIDAVAKSKARNIGRVLFNSTALLGDRFPLLDSDPLVLHGLIRMLKEQNIGLMAIGVMETGRDDRIKGLAAMADLKVTVHHRDDFRLPGYVRKTLRKREIKAKSGIRVISSDNVTGKDYDKRYATIAVETVQSEPHLSIVRIDNDIDTD
jgi:KaiC/GvpD/RAD55 family RecA-like ATPase